MRARVSVCSIDELVTHAEAQLEHRGVAHLSLCSESLKGEGTCTSFHHGDDQTNSVIPKSKRYDPLTRFMVVDATLDREGKSVWRVEKTPQRHTITHKDC